MTNCAVCAGSFGPSVLLVGLSFLDCSQTALAVALLTVAVSVSGCVFSGYFVNHMDIAPQYAGTLMGISNCVAASSGFIAPYVTSVLTIAVSMPKTVSLSYLSSRLSGCDSLQLQYTTLCIYMAVCLFCK